jgi:predicted MFS family arabinose efflux permease
MSPALRRLVRNRNFGLYFAGRLVSVVGDSFYSVALILAVLQSTHSITAGATVLIAGMIPVVILTLIGGTVSDRLPRSRVMLASDLVRSATQFVMAALLLRAHAPLWALMVSQFCYGAGEAFFDPAATGLLPQIVASEDLPVANSALALAASGALVAGPALAGIVIAVAGAPLAVAFDAITFALSAISLCLLRVQPGGRAPASDAMLEQLRAGFAELRRHRWVMLTACYLAFLAFAFNGTMFALGPAVALSRLGGPAAWSLILSAFGIGLLAGSFAAVPLLRTRGALGWAYVGNVGLVPVLALLGTTHSRWLIAASSVLAGISVAVFSITWPTLLGQTIAPAMLSRVGSYFWLARVTGTPLALALAGPGAARFGMSPIFIAAALAIGVVTIIVAAVPQVWSIRRDGDLAERQVAAR